MDVSRSRPSRAPRRSSFGGRNAPRSPPLPSKRGARRRGRRLRRGSRRRRARGRRRRAGRAGCLEERGGGGRRVAERLAVSRGRTVCASGLCGRRLRGGSARLRTGSRPLRAALRRWGRGLLAAGRGWRAGSAARAGGWAGLCCCGTPPPSCGGTGGGGACTRPSRSIARRRAALPTTRRRAKWCRRSRSRPASGILLAGQRASARRAAGRAGGCWERERPPSSDATGEEGASPQLWHTKQRTSSGACSQRWQAQRKPCCESSCARRSAVCR